MEAHPIKIDFKATPSTVAKKRPSTAIPWLGPFHPSIAPLNIKESGVRKLLSKLKPGKAFEPDQIPNPVLIETSDELAPVLTALYNQSISPGEIPKDWTDAFITPVYKKGNAHDASNYRPVSLTSVSCKLLEHIICKHIITSREHEPLTTLQHDFRKNS